MTNESDVLDHPGLAVLEDVGWQLARGLGSEDVLVGVAGALNRRLQTDACVIWVRTPDGAAFRPVFADGMPYPPGDRADQVMQWVQGGPVEELDDGRWRIRIPLVHEGEHLGLLETAIRDSAESTVFRKVIGIVANILAPLLGSFELSEDLASEVAIRTRETEAQRRFTSKIIDSLPVGLYVIDRDYVIQAWNRKRETGKQGVDRDRAVGRSVFEVLHLQSRDLLRQEFDSVFRTGRIEQVEVQSSSSGEPRHYRITKVPMRLDDDEITHVITIGEDLTDWKMVQRQAAQTEKLAAVGQLAAGVMHELNNPLATIGACVEALTVRSEDLSESQRSSIEEYLRIVESELGRCKAIVDGLLDFSRPKSRMMREVQLNQVVEDALFLVKHHDRFKRIRLDRQLGAHLPSVMANSEQLVQVFLALMLNAIDAMEGTGVLTVTTGISLDSEGEIVVEFTDTGMGIPADELPKIFEPFFSTKQPGRGTGLGLSICYGVVQQHGGRIEVDSAMGHGSTFRVYLPLYSGQEQP
jgi:two-component system NtrC family sensor kinase